MVFSFVLDERKDASECLREFICMCERCFYKYKVLMMAVKQSKEGREDEGGGGRKEGWSHFTAEEKVRLGIPLSSISSLQSNDTAYHSLSPFVSEIHLKGDD